MAGLPKYTSPLAPVPSWLSPSAEVPPGNPVVMSRERFVPWCVDMFVIARAPLLRAFELTACKITETAWGASIRGWNAGGVKATEAWAKTYQALTGKPAPYYRAHGNKGTGDAQTVIYRAYASPEEFFREWMAVFVPKDASKGSRYRETGRLFWNDGDWFPAMLAAGYRGSVTKAKPATAIADQASLTKSARIYWAQARLPGLVVDGKWGPKSRDACIAFQTRHGLPVSGEINDATLLALARHTTPNIPNVII